MEDVTQEIIDDVIINRVNLSRVTLNESAELKNLIDEQITIGHTKIVVDLNQCTHLDTTLFGVLVATHKKLLAKGGELRIVITMSPERDQFFYLTGISKVLNTFETSEDAVKSFSNRIKPPQPKPDRAVSKQSVAWEFS